eukprot:Gb_02207 [translate_table: standard]
MHFYDSRSSSTPVLGSQASSGLFLDGVNGGDGEVGVPLFADNAKQFSFPCVQSGFQSISNFASPASQHMTATCDDTCSLDAKRWDFDGEVVPWLNFRQTQSETDLQSLGRSSSTPAKVVAKSLLHGTDSSYDDFHVSSSRKQWSRRLMSRKRLQSIPSFSFSEHESEDDEDLGPDPRKIAARGSALAAMLATRTEQLVTAQVAFSASDPSLPPLELMTSNANNSSFYNIQGGHGRLSGGALYVPAGFEPEPLGLCLVILKEWERDSIL